MISSMPISGSAVMSSAKRWHCQSRCARGGEYQCAYQIVVVLKVRLLLLHGSEYGLEGGDKIVEDDGSPLLALFCVEAASMNDAHLLQYGGLAALTSTLSFSVSGPEGCLGCQSN